MSDNNGCEKCGTSIPDGMKRFRKCEGKQFVDGAKSLFSHLLHDAKNLAAKMKKVRVKTDQ